MRFHDFLKMQRQLQINMKEANPSQGGDPLEMDEESLAQFITWNHTALTVELSEMMAEVGWKPWATARYANHPAAMREMVDAMHFFLNILLALAAFAGLTPEEMAQQFEDYYKEKNATNLKRQIEGYDGLLGKCPVCHRDLQELPSTEATVVIDDVEYCSTLCAEEAQHE